MNSGVMLPVYSGGAEDPQLSSCLCNGNFEMAILAGIREKIALASILEKPQYHLPQLLVSPIVCVTAAS